MLNSPSQISGEPAVLKKAAQSESRIKVLADGMEKALCVLREEVLGIGSKFSDVIRPEPPTNEPTAEKGSGPQAPLEKWLCDKIETIESFVVIIRNYKERCIL